MHENTARALDTFRGDPEAMQRGQTRVDLPNGHFASVSRRGDFDYVHLYDLRSQTVEAKRFRHNAPQS